MQNYRRRLFQIFFCLADQLEKRIHPEFLFLTGNEAEMVKCHMNGQHIRFVKLIQSAQYAEEFFRCFKMIEVDGVFENPPRL